MSTPAALRITTELDHYFRQLDRERITHWLMHLSSGRTTDIDDGLGGRIRIGGVGFEGTPQKVFWRFMHPILEAKIVEVCRDVEQETRDYDPADADRTIEVIRGALKGLVGRTFRQMAVVDQRLRGKGFPERVPMRDVTREVSRHHHFIDANVAALRARIKPKPEPSMREKLKAWAGQNYWQVVTIIVAIVGIVVPLLVGMLI